PTGISDTQLTITVPFYAQSGPITVYNTAGSVTSSASFTATSAPPMTLSPLSATFGNQVVGTTSSPQTFTVTNHTGSAINMGGIVIGGSNSSDYSHAGTCSPNSPVAAGGSCTIDVTFTPTATGTRAATLQVGFSASNSPQVASLTGTGTSSSGGGGGSGPAVVQVQNNIDVSGAAYASFSVPITTKPDDLLVAFVRESSNGTDNFTVTDSSGQTWTQTTSGYNNE